MLPKPKMFIGSSAEGLPVARAVQAELSYEVESTIWNQGVFELSKGTLPQLIEATKRFDYAAFVLTTDDVLRMRGNDYVVARDNVVFELGMFFGALGSSRCFFLMPKDAPGFHVATDLAGITPATYDPKHSGGLQAGVGPACNQIRNALLSSQHVESLSGTWNVVWKVTIDGELREYESDAYVSQADDRVRAFWRAFNKDYELEATIERGNVITGRWRDQRSGPTYFGAFQLAVSPLANEMSGKWVGWSKTGIIRAGDWAWKKASDNSS